MIEKGITPEHIQYAAESALGLYALSMAFSFKIKQEVRKRQGYRCDSCGERVPRPNQLQVHHRIPRALGGPDTINNAVGLCQECHCEIDREAFRGEIYPEVHTPRYYLPQGNR